MRKITDHIVDGDSANHQLKVTVIDELGAGGACHYYEIEIPNPQIIAGVEKSIFPCIFPVVFQNGPIKDVGVNGVTHEALLAILIDRLRSFQAGPFSCRENAIALTHCEDALMWLQRRTRARIARGVEGTHEK